MDNTVSAAALRFLDKLTPYVHKRHYIVCLHPDAEVGNVCAIYKPEIYKYVGVSEGYARKILKELMIAGYVAFFEVGYDVKLAVNPLKHRISSEIEPSEFIVNTFRMHERFAGVSTFE